MTLQNRAGGPAAVLWDYDGTLLDTEPIWIEVEQAMVAERGGVWTHEQGIALVGRSWQEASEALIEAIGDDTIDPHAFYLERIEAVTKVVREADELPWRPGAKELFDELAELGVPMALVSASGHSLLNAGLDRMRHERFGVIVSGDDVTEGKPNPEGYLKAAAALGVDARDCIVIEDSLSGTTAGRRAGALVIAVPCMTPLPSAPGQIVVDSLEGIDVAWLRETFKKVRADK